MSDHLRLIRTRAWALLARLRGEEAGMTLIEVLVAVMVLLIGILPTVKVFNDSRDQNATGEHHEIALLQAEQALEEMRGLPYNHLAMNAAASDPGDGRVSGTTLRARSDLSEPLATYSTEGMAAGDAWVDPVSQVTTGSTEAPVNMTVYRFVSWRDEECRVTDLSGLGVGDLSTEIGAVPTLNSLLGSLLSALLSGLGNQDKALLNTLNNRVTALKSALGSRQSQLSGALDGVSQLDLCDLDSQTLQSLQELGDLAPSLHTLTAQLGVLPSVLPSVCVLSCSLTPQAKTQITAVNSQLNCMFGSSADTTAEFNTYLDGVTSGLSGLPGDLGNTVKNTKRISVAVVIDTPTGSGPDAPVWASSVVRDPTAGVLSNGGASCSA